MADVSLIVPALDEAGAITPTLDRAFAVLRTLGPASEVIVVDDGSTDATGELAAAAGARVVRHAHNVGYGRSLKTGITAAANDIVAIMDGDGTYPVESLPQLVAEMARGYDMVVAARTGAQYRGPGTKGPLRSILTFLVEFTTGRTVPDVNSGLRVFRRSTVMTYFGQLCDTFSFTTSLTLAYMMTGRFVKYVPIEYGVRTGQTKVRLFRDSLRTMQYIVQAIAYYNPIKLFLLLAIAAMVITIAGVAVLAVSAPWLAVVVACLGSIGAVILFAFGIVADVMRQTRIQAP
jgi:glycosyltransferase involved in cell wall biosynthesis